MKEVLDNGFIKLLASDWRYASAIVGLKRFFDTLNIKEGYSYNEDEFIYNPQFLTKSNFAQFIDLWYGTKLKYNEALSLLERNDSFEAETIKNINTLLTQNKVLKDIFGTHKFTGENVEEIKNLIEVNKEIFAINLFSNMKTMYSKYCNKNSLFNDDSGICRLVGYYEDLGKKQKQLCWFFDKTTYSYNDCIEFDFVPFGFSYGYNSCFINCNYDLNSLFKVNDDLKRSIGDKDKPNFADIISSITDLISYNCEIIVNKSYSNPDGTIDNVGYFSTMLFSNEIIEKIEESKPYLEKLNYIKQKNDFINIKELAYEYIANNMNLDRIIVNLFKIEKTNYYIDSLIKINLIINERNNDMEEKIKRVKACAYHVKQQLKKNQVNSFKQKLISAVTYDDKDSVFAILTKLSDTSGVSLSFIYDILENYDDNKTLVYSFINALSDFPSGDQKTDKN